jgi:hypothetical protein
MIPVDVRRARGTAGRAATRAAFALALGVLAGCARPGPPPGGPADSTPPEVARTTPADGGVLVDRSVVIEIEFSEEMDRQSVERAFSLTPEVALASLRWKGKALRAEPEEALPDSTTFVAAVGDAARDYHGVAIAAPYSFAFSTGSAVDAGVLAGVVTVLGEPIGGAVVWACEGDVNTDSLGVVAPCAYAATSADDGGFTLSNVRASALAYSLVAFVDRNGDGRWETGSETGWIVPTAARVEAPGDSVGGLAIEMRPPAGGGSKAGGEEGR